MIRINLDGVRASEPPRFPERSAINSKSNSNQIALPHRCVSRPKKISGRQAGQGHAKHPRAPSCRYAEHRRSRLGHVRRFVGEYPRCTVGRFCGIELRLIEVDVSSPIFAPRQSSALRPHTGTGPSMIAWLCKMRDPTPSECVHHPCKNL